MTLTLALPFAGFAISADPFVRCHEVIEVLISQPLYDLCSCRLIEVKTLAQPLLMDRHRDAGDTHHLTLAHIIRCVAAVLQIIEESLCDMLGVFPDDIIALLQVLGVDPKQRAFDIGPCLLYTSPSPRDRQKSRMPSSA